MVKRVTALLRISQQESVEVISQELDGSVSSVYDWLKKLVYEGGRGWRCAGGADDAVS